MASYTWDAADYERHSGPQQAWAQNLLDGLDLNGDERLLDIGCGDGKITAALAHRLPEGTVLGIDSAAEMVALAQARYPEDDFSNLRFQRADARELTFREAFDVVFSNSALHWIPEHRPVLQGIARALRPGGRALLQMGAKGNGEALLRTADALIETSPWRPYFKDFGTPYTFCGPSEYRLWLEEARLHPLRVEQVPKDMTHDGPEALARWLRPVLLPYLERLPEAKRDRFIEELVASYVQDHPVDEQGCTHVRMVRLVVEAEKPRRPPREPKA